MISLTCEIEKNNINELISKIEIDSTNMEKTNLCLSEGIVMGCVCV